MFHFSLDPNLEANKLLDTDHIFPDGRLNKSIEESLEDAIKDQLSPKLEPIEPLSFETKFEPIEIEWKWKDPVSKKEFSGTTTVGGIEHIRAQRAKLPIYEFRSQFLVNYSGYPLNLHVYDCLSILTLECGQHPSSGGHGRRDGFREEHPNAPISSGIRYRLRGKNWNYAAQKGSCRVRGSAGG